MKHFIITICILIFLSSCNYEQVTTEYTSYKNAHKDDFFAKGWIPYELQDSTMTEIYVRSNVDLNTYIFSFSTQLGFSNMPPMSLSKITEPIEIPGIDIPNWWNEGILNKPTTLFPINHTDKVKLVFDEKNGMIYGWNEKSR